MKAKRKKKLTKSDGLRVSSTERTGCLQTSNGMTTRPLNKTPVVFYKIYADLKVSKYVFLRR